MRLVPEFSRALRQQSQNGAADIVSGGRHHFAAYTNLTCLQHVATLEYVTCKLRVALTPGLSDTGFNINPLQADCRLCLKDVRFIRSFANGPAKTWGPDPRCSGGVNSFGPLHGWPVAHALAMVQQLGELRGVDAIALKPLADGIEIGIGDAIIYAHHPWPLEHRCLDQRRAVRHVLSHFPAHRFMGCHIIRPSGAAQLMGMVHMHGGAEIAVERLHFREGKGIANRGQLQLGIVLPRSFRLSSAAGPAELSRPYPHGDQAA